MDEDNEYGAQLRLEIFPPNCGEAQLRQVGINVGNGVTVVFTADVDEDQIPFLSLTVGGGPDASLEGLDEIADLFEFLSEVMRDQGFREDFLRNTAFISKDDYTD